MDRPVYEAATPENLTLHFERAGLASRALALCVDWLFMALLLQGAYLLLTPFYAVSRAAGTALLIVAAFAVQWWYGALSEWRFGGTLGKRLLGLMVVDEQGLPLRFGQSVIRNLLRIVDLLPLLHLTGAAACLLDPHARRLGDLAARTVVVRRSPPADEREEREERAARPPLERSAHLAAVVDRLTQDEQRAIERLCALRDALSLADRAMLCDALVGHLVRARGLVLPAHVSSERLLLQLESAQRVRCPR